MRLTFSLVIFALILSCSSTTKEKRKYVFLDVGSAKGVSIDAFKTTGLYKQYLWKIFAIEPSPDFYTVIPKASDVTVIPEAAWLYDGRLEFFKTTSRDETSNSIYFRKDKNKEKVSWPCFHFSRFLKENFSKDDFVILSLDIAGAEPEILELLLKEGTIDLIDRAYVEFSIDMMTEDDHPLETDNQFRRAYSIIQKIRARGVFFDGDSVEDVIHERNTWLDHL